MAKFCTKCGKPLEEGVLCSCQSNVTTSFNQPMFNQVSVPTESFSVNLEPIDNTTYNSGFNTDIRQNRCPLCGRELALGSVCVCTQQSTTPSKKAETNVKNSVWHIIKNHMGIGEIEDNTPDAYETSKHIVPDVVKSYEGEVPVKQFTVAKLRNRFFGIPYMRAIGRVQVTNKRVIFRAPGRCIAGKTTVQHEFAIDEIAGVEARKEFVFNLWDLFYGIIFALCAGFLFTWIDAKLLNVTGSYLFTTLVTVFLAMIGVLPFVLLRKKWWLKLSFLGGATISLFTIASVGGYFGYAWLGNILKVFSLFSFVLTLISLFFHVINPSLVLIIKTKNAAQAVDISRKRTGILALLYRGVIQSEDHTGFSEVIPEKDWDKFVKELGSLISDIQKA